ncbi:MAG: PaaI family thioesterase [Pseudomonadota bacterium]
MKGLKIPVFFAQTLDEMASREDLLSRSGMEFLQDIMAGRISAAPLAKTLNFQMTEIADGEVTFEGMPEVYCTNPMRGVHGGWYGALLDSVMGCAVMTRVPKGWVYTTLEYKVNLTRAIKIGQRVQAKGLIDHTGRSTATARGEVRGLEDGRLYATATTTCLIMQAEP